MAETETETENKSKIVTAQDGSVPQGATQAEDEKVICLFPGCEREAVPPPQAAEGRTGPPPRYCDLEEHNASSTHQELKRLENEASEDA